MDKFLVKFFKLGEKSTTIKNEINAGAYTFLAMSYIIFMEPAILRQAGMSFSAVMTATCLCAGLMCILTGVIANSPVTAAPLMGENLVFVFTLVIAMQWKWQHAIALVMVEGLIFLGLTAFKLRDYAVKSVPASLRYAMAAGTGIFIAMLGLKWSGIIVPDAYSLVRLGNLRSPEVLVSIAGLVAIITLFVRNVKGSIMLGTLIALVVALIAGVVKFNGIVSAPPSVQSVFMQFDFAHLKALDFVFGVVILLYMNIFNTIGSVLSVKNPGAMKVLVIEAIGTPIGALFGTSGVSSYIESNAGGVAQRGKSGLSNTVTGLLFLAAVFIYPLMRGIGTGVSLSKYYVLYPVAAPALIMIGFLMLKNVLKLNLEDLSETLPACMTLIITPLTFNIAHGIAFGVISYPIVKLISGKYKEVTPLMYILAAGFILYYIFA